MKKDKVKMILPFVPLIVFFAIIILKPYYLFPLGGDTDFHLARARAILENPFYGFFWDYITYYPLGRPVWHQPLFHVISAGLWYLGGVRFAQAFLAIFQVLLTVGVASWIANKEYGTLAGFFAGIFALSCPLQYALILPIPATFIPIFAMLTIYYMPKSKKKAFVASLAGLWTHMVGIVSFIPLFLVDDYKNRENLKIIALLTPSFLFWVGYWIYFRDRLVTGGTFYSLLHIHMGIPLNFEGIYPFIIVYLFGIIGLYFLFKINRKQFNLITTYVIIVILTSLFGFGGDFLRGFQFAALPMAILSGLTVQKSYNYFSLNYSKIFTAICLSMFLITSLFGALIFFAQLPDQNGKGWDALNYPFEGKYTPLKIFIDTNTNKNDIIWAQPELSEKIAWMTGRTVSNGIYQDGQYGATRGFVDQHQNINVYLQNKTVLIKDINNKTLKEFNLDI